MKKGFFASVALAARAGVALGQGTPSRRRTGRLCGMGEPACRPPGGTVSPDARPGRRDGRPDGIPAPAGGGAGMPAGHLPLSAHAARTAITRSTRTSQVRDPRPDSRSHQ